MSIAQLYAISSNPAKVLKLGKGGMQAGTLFIGGLPCGHNSMASQTEKGFWSRATANKTMQKTVSARRSFYTIARFKVWGWYRLYTAGQGAKTAFDCRR